MNKMSPYGPGLNFMVIGTTDMKGTAMTANSVSWPHLVPATSDAGVMLFKSKDWGG